MPRRSTVERLPKDLREEIARLRVDHGRTIDEILGKLRELDPEAAVSRSALGRHVQRLDRMSERLRRSRALAEGLARQLGDKPGDQVARVNIELLHSFLADALAAADEEGSEEGEAVRQALLNPKGAALFAEAVERLTKASRHNAEFVAAVEKRAAERERKEAATRAETAARSAGLTGAVVEAIKASVFGVKVGAA